MITDSIKLMNEYLFRNYNEDMGIDWFDNQGIIRLNRKGFIAIVTLDSNVTNYYKFYIVDIVCIEKGLISSKRFNFEDYFDSVFVHKEKSNKFKLYPNDFNIDFDILVKRIFDYINYFN
jgi:hypothetical protein